MIGFEELERPEIRASLTAADVRELMAAGGDLSPSTWDMDELCDLSPAALAAYLATMRPDDLDWWIDETFATAEQFNDEAWHKLAWRANDLQQLLKRGARPDDIWLSLYRGLCTGPDDESEPPRRPDRTAPDYVPPFGFAVAPDGELVPEPEQQATPRFQLLTPAELAELPPLRWRVRGVLPESGLAALYGPPGCGKSFLALDMLAAIAEGRAWFGYAATACSVVYVGLEGEAGVAQRVQAHIARHGTPDRLRVILSPLDIRRHDDRLELADTIRAAGFHDGVLCVDTLNRAAPGVDENDAAEMGLIIEAMKALQADLGGLVLVVHHAGKDATRGLRGHSSLLAALDAVLEITREGERREWKLAKLKDGIDDQAQPFRLDVVDLGTDAEGWPVSSCIVTPEAPAAEQVRQAKVPSGGNQRLVWDGLHELLKVSRDFGKSDAPALRPCIALDDAIARLKGRLAVAPDRQGERVRQAITGLVNRGLLNLRDGWLWLP